MYYELIAPLIKQLTIVTNYLIISYILIFGLICAIVGLATIVFKQNEIIHNLKCIGKEKPMKTIGNNKGFTLIEVILVVLILAILIFGVLPLVSNDAATDNQPPLVQGRVITYGDVMVYDSLPGNNESYSKFKYIVKYDDVLDIAGEDGDYYCIPDNKTFNIYDYINKKHVKLDNEFSR